MSNDSDLLPASIQHSTLNIHHSTFDSPPCRAPFEVTRCGASDSCLSWPRSERLRRVAQQAGIPHRGLARMVRYRSSSSRSNRSLARTGSCARRRQAAMMAAMQRRVGSIRPIRIRKRCWRLYPDSRARCAGLIPRLFRYCSSRVGMCNIVHLMPMHDVCQSIGASPRSENPSVLTCGAQNPAFVPSFLSNHHPMFLFPV
jgi:hypothetical protein